MIKDDLINDITALGGYPLYVLVLLIAFAANQKQLTLQLLFGIILTGAAVSAIRIIYFKQRPKKEKYSNIIEKVYSSSFPSLHSTQSTVLGILLMNFFKVGWLSLLFGLLIISVSVTRIMLRKHDWKDALSGIILGILISLAIMILGVPNLRI